MAQERQPPMDLLDYGRNVFSQNGEDGMIEELFRRIGIEARTCCEFGAWDGKHLSNCRHLILAGWRAMMIEAEPAKAKILMETYCDTPAVTCVQRLVGVGENSLSSILKGAAFPQDLDLLSVDIDGLDYEIFENLDLRPRVICIEVNAAFSPDSREVFARDIAARSLGQPLGVFMRIASAKGYALVGYSGNAFFVRDDIVQRLALRGLTPTEAYASYLRHLQPADREWLYLTNLGLTRPYHRYHNPRLKFKALGIPLHRWLPMHWLAVKRAFSHVAGYFRSRLAK